MKRPDPLALRRITPSRLGHPVARRWPDINDVPDPRNAYRKTLDDGLLRDIARRAFVDHLEKAPPAGWRERVGELLLADLDRRYPPGKMAVLAEFDMARTATVIAVEVAPAEPAARFDIPCRLLPDRPGVNQYTARAIQAGGRLASVPAIVQPVFDLLAIAYAGRGAQFTPASGYPSAFEKEHGRPPKWLEIGAAFPLVGAWMAQQVRAACMSYAPAPVGQ